MGIKILLEEGPKLRKGAGGIVLANMEDVERARGLGWGWKEISKELGVESPQAVRKAYVRIKKRIDSGKLKIPGKDQQKNRKEERKEEKKESPGPGGPAPEKGPGPRLITKQPGGGTDFFENLPKA
ncbi:hypothetical protein [Leptospirillum ferriphilum]|uniref:Uncharacterized protein n=1 Tax=Leptospirillum ferriphilum (strain ML-04) TaxID=1048260 RepID=J9ZBS7_LEPFM|nr:hypothetical protein [Leptospirillum ferriphilum]AFS53879.1 hypothetical protein LFML04_1677 [Leptospirillum ferriphilum ML-04]